MSNAKHAKYSPSQLSRIIACPGSVFMSEGIEQLPTSPYAAEGTMLHSYMEQYIDSNTMPDVCALITRSSWNGAWITSRPFVTATVRSLLKCI